MRRRNEDAVLERPDIGLWAVADGAGGHHCGDYASGSVVAALRDLPLAAPGPLFFEEIKMVLRRLNPAGAPRGCINRPHCGNRQHRCRCAHLWKPKLLPVGRRQPVISDACRRLRQLTAEHQSYVQALVDRGEIGAEAAATHPFANVVCNLIGGSDELVLEERQDQLEPGDILLLCSDGLTRAVVDADIADILRNTPVRAAADRLVERALFYGTRDNVSVVTIHYSGQ